MPDPVHVVCPHCDATNRVPAGRLAEAPKCGACGVPLFEGRPVSLSEPRFRHHLERSGIPLLVDFWASWCGPCRTEAPALEAFQRRHGGDRFTVLGINLDDTTSDAGAFVERYGLTYPQLRDGDGRDRRDAYGMTGFPESFLVDPEGGLALIRRGPVDERYLNESVEPLIRRGS